MGRSGREFVVGGFYAVGGVCGGRSLSTTRSGSWCRDVGRSLWYMGIDRLFVIMVELLTFPAHPCGARDSEHPRGPRELGGDGKSGARGHV